LLIIFLPSSAKVRCGAAGADAAQGYDSYSHCGGIAAHHVEHENRLGSDAEHFRAYGRRHGVRAGFVDVCDTSGLLPDKPTSPTIGHTSPNHSFTRQPPGMKNPGPWPCQSPVLPQLITEEN
jgi:hypothetical protein